MSMREEAREPRSEKVAVVTMLAEKLNTAKGIYLTDFTGLSVAQITELRKRFRDSKTEFVVVKNTLARLGAKEAGQEGMLPYLEGPTGLAFNYEDAASPARVLKGFVKDHQKPGIKACIIEGDILPGSEAENIANWPTREELLAKLVGSLNAPISGLVGALSGVPRKLVYVLSAIAAKKQEG